MENKVFEANLGEISKYNKALSDRILFLNSFRQNIELCQNQNGEYNLSVNGILIHSTKSATEEAKEIVNKISNIDEENSIFVLFGIGLGYLLDEFYTRAKGQIILFEPNIEILKSTLEIVELSHILKDIKIVDNFNDLKKILYSTSEKETKISVSFLNSYWNVYKAEIVETAKEIEHIQGAYFAGEKMIIEIGRDAINNTLNNLKYFSNATFIGDLRGILKDKTALITSAGPSLGKNIEKIKKYRDKFVIFSIGAAYKTLVNNGIQPDFLSIIEPRNTIGQIEGLDISNVSLILEPATNPNIWELPAKRKILFLSKENFINDWLSGSLGLNNSQLKIFGTVSYCSLLAAQFMGAKNIVLIGEDLAYSDSKCYAKGSAYEELECIFDEEIGKYKIVPKDKEKYLLSLLGAENINNETKRIYADNYLKTLNDNLYTVMGQNGEKLPTQTAYAMFVKHHEEFAQQNYGIFGPQAKLINSSTGGAQINGFENIDVEEVALKIASDNNKYELSEKFIQMDNIKNKMLPLENDINSGTNDILELFELAQSISLEFKRRRIVTDNIQKMLDKLDEKNKIYRAKYLKYGSIVYYIFLEFYTEFNKITRSKDAKKILQAQEAIQQFINAVNDISRHYREMIEIIKGRK